MLEVNETLPDSLEILRSDPYVAGWIMKVKISDESSLSKLMDFTAYEEQCNEAG